MSGGEISGLGGLGLYRNVTPLDSGADADLRVQPIPDFSFARELKDCVITVDEFAAACHSQPIVFGHGAEGRLFAAAILGLPDTGNVFIDPATGNWRVGDYIPAFIRRYPFVPITDGDRFALGIDRAYPGLSKDSGERLFENGQPTAYTRHVLAFMAEFQAAWDRTLALVKALEVLKLLEPFQVTAKRADRQQVIGQLYRVSEAKFNELKDKDSLRLIRNSGLKLAVAQMLSLAQFEKLDIYSR